MRLPPNACRPSPDFVAVCTASCAKVVRGKVRTYEIAAILTWSGDPGYPCETGSHSRQDPAHGTEILFKQFSAFCMFRSVDAAPKRGDYQGGHRSNPYACYNTHACRQESTYRCVGGSAECMAVPLSGMGVCRLDATLLPRRGSDRSRSLGPQRLV